MSCKLGVAVLGGFHDDGGLRPCGATARDWAQVMGQNGEKYPGQMTFFRGSDQDCYSNSPLVELCSTCVVTVT